MGVTRVSARGFLNLNLPPGVESVGRKVLLAFQPDPHRFPGGGGTSLEAGMAEWIQQSFQVEHQGFSFSATLGESSITLKGSHPGPSLSSSLTLIPADQNEARRLAMVFRRVARRLEEMNDFQGLIPPCLLTDEVF